MASACAFWREKVGWWKSPRLQHLLKQDVVVKWNSQLNWRDKLQTFTSMWHVLQHVPIVTTEPWLTKTGSVEIEWDFLQPLVSTVNSFLIIQMITYSGALCAQVSLTWILCPSLLDDLLCCYINMLEFFTNYMKSTIIPNISIACKQNISLTKCNPHEDWAKVSD